MSPEELLQAENLPPDLQWVAKHYRLHPEDPVYLLIAWHWIRAKSAEDTLQAAIVELKTALDDRIETLVDAADTVAGINAVLEEVQQELSVRPAILGKELDAQLRQPVAGALAQLQGLEKALTPVAHSFRAVQRRELLAVLLTGVALGGIGVVVLLHV